MRGQPVQIEVARRERECRICGVPAKPLWHGRCKACMTYFRNHSRERSEYLCERQARDCTWCGNTLPSPAGHRRSFCSTGCKLAARRLREWAKRRTNTEVVNCDVCGASYERLVLHTSRGARCEVCRYAPGPTHHNWKGGWFNKALGRWIVHTPDGREMSRARWVMEQHIGRPVRSDEHVHHINRDKADDRLENLELLSASEHGRLHGLEQADHLRGLAQVAASKTHCVHGHEYTPETTYLDPHGHRRCRECKRARDRGEVLA